MASANVNGHVIDVSVNRFTGKEHVSYDGESMSSKRNFKRSALHEFVVTEDGEPATYEVQTSNNVVTAGLGAIRRNGETV